MALDSYAAGTILVLTSTALAVLGLLFVRKRYTAHNWARAHDLSGQYLQLVGTMYAVLLGLIVVDAMTRFQDAINKVEMEANSLAELNYLAGRMPSAQRSLVQTRTAAYAHLVVEREWAMMEKGLHHEGAQQAAIDLMRTIRDWEPVSESEKAIYATAVPAASNFWSARRGRVIGCQGGIPPLEWSVVILGGIVTIGMTYVLVFEDLKIQVALTSIVTLMIAFNIFLVCLFGYPFSGDVCVSPESFRAALAEVSLGAPMTESAH